MKSSNVSSVAEDESDVETILLVSASDVHSTNDWVLDSSCFYHVSYQEIVCYLRADKCWNYFDRE